MTRPRDGAAIAAIFAEGLTAVSPRGLGRSYGDAAQIGGGIVLDCTGIDRVLDFDESTGAVRVGAGCSLDALMRLFIPRGRFVPVTPGTRFVTVGGAIAADIHGKNHHVAGTFSSHVGEVTLVTPNGTHTISKTAEPELFDATTGGMGLTGIAVEAMVNLIPIETSSMVVDTERAADLDECLALMSEGDDAYDYSVAWIDCLARGNRLGRSVLTRGNHARIADLRAPQGSDPLVFRPKAGPSVPVQAPTWCLNPFTVAAFNQAWFRKAPTRRIGEIQTIAEFFHPLDAIGSWNLLYGARGFTQYQCVVPFGAEKVIATLLERLASARAASFLAVLKRFGPQGSGHLSFPMSGWTLALDLPLGRTGVPELLDGLDEEVTAAGGRVYFAKDGRLRPASVPTMYPRLEAWREIRETVDPNHLLQSDLSRRLHLLG